MPKSKKLEGKTEKVQVKSEVIKHEVEAEDNEEKNKINLFNIYYFRILLINF
jgi:hypothetical protein